MAVLALAVAMVPTAARAAQQATVAALPVDPSGPASLFRPAMLSGAFRVPRVDTALYIGTPWLVRDLTVMIVRRDGRRERLDATTDIPGRILGVRLPLDASRADRIEYEARSVSAAAAPYVISADALASMNARVWPFAAACGALAMLTTLLAALAAIRRAPAAGWLAVGAAAQAGLLVPWLGIVRPSPELSQPLHAALQTISLAALAAFTASLFRLMKLSPRALRARVADVAFGALWALVALNAFAAFGGDVMQDLWPLPNAVNVGLAIGFDLALVALGAIAVPERAAGARAYLAGAAAVTGAFAMTLLDPSSAAALIGPVAGAFCFAAATYAAILRPSAASQAPPASQLPTARPQTLPESPTASQPPASAPAARPIFGAPPPREVTTDGLTGAANRSALSAALDRAWEAARTAGTPLALLRLDVDHFRRYNELHGPAAGDEALCRITTSVAATLPPHAPGALVARDGGDELCILLPGASLAAAHGYGERIRAAVDALAIARDDVPARRITVSIGAASIDPSIVDDPFVAFARANAALYIAKAMGRDRVVVDEPIQAFAKSESASD